MPSTTRSLWLGASATVAAHMIVGAPAQAATVTGIGTAESPAQVEVIGKREAPLDRETGLSTLPTTVQDTPQAINVIDSAQLKQQGINTLEQALRNVPGITVSIGEGGTLSGDQFKIRGFDASNDVYVDGLRDFGVYVRDSFDYQEVQVLKGPSGALFGRGSVGGAINVISKAPKLATFGEVDGYAGNGSYYRALGDFNQQIGPNSALRLNLMASSTGVVDQDHIFSKRYGAAAAAGFGLGTDTSFTVNFLHQDDRRRPDYGVPVIQPPGSLYALPATSYGLPRSTYLGYETDADHTRADVLTTRFKKIVNPNLTLTSDTRLGVYSRYFQYTTVDTCNATCTANFFDNNPATVPLANYGGSGPYKQRDWGAQNISTARFDFNLGGFRNEMIAGFDVSYQNNKKTFDGYALPAGFATRNTIPQPLLTPFYNPPAGYSVFKPTKANLHCPTVGTANCTVTINGVTSTSSYAATGVVYTAGDSEDYGAFLTDQFFITPTLSVLGSLREDHYVANYDTTSALFVTTPLKSTNDLFDPRVSLIYEPTKTQTYYLSYGRSSTPQGSSIVGAGTAIALTAKDLQPEVATTYEAGAKIGLLGGRLSATGSVFEIKKTNATQTDPSTGFLVANSGDTQQVRGVEVGLTGKITPVWTLSLGYSYLDARIRQDFSCSTATLTVPSVCKLNRFVIGQHVELVPPNSASLWTNYDLAALVKGLSVGGGATYQSRMPLRYNYAGTAPNITGISKIGEAPENLSFDGVLAYTSGRYRVAVNGYNLGDRLNSTQVFGSRGVVAAGRTIIASLSVNF